MTDPDTASGRVSVRFVTHPHSVRTARQLVADTLHGWDLSALVNDAGLVVTELCTNAMLHSGAAYFSVSVTTSASHGVQVAVGDEGEVPAAAVVRRRARLQADPSAGLRSEATTGRGLAIVEQLSAAWGVTVDGARKWVWALLTVDGDVGEAVDLPAGPPAPADLVHGGALPPGWHAVRLEDCPVALSLAQDDHLDELVRELQLVVPSGEHPALASVIHGLLEGQAAARHMGRRTAQDAAAEGRQHVTVEMLLPERAADDVRRLHAAVLAADDLCNSQELLTLASSHDVRRLRTWMHDEILAQIEHARPPRDFATWLAGTAAG